MPRFRGTTSRIAPSVNLSMALGGAAVLALTLAVAVGLASDVGELLVRNTIRLSLTWYGVALLVMMRLAPADWAANADVGRLARWCWTWAWACFVVHVALAFHYYDHWSHAAAFERTREVSGIGEGLYVSYAFTLAWTVDVWLWWLRPADYATRPKWVGIVLHTTMLFIVFNGMVVFETGLIRWAGVIMFVVLAVAWVLTRSNRVSQTA
jgi:hypothetical protein